MYVLLSLSKFAAAPGAPKGLILSEFPPFSVQIYWNAPSDVGNPRGPLTYTVTLEITNITDGTVLQYTLPSTQITLSNLLPGVQYNVSVYAKNSVASGPPVTRVFRTNNTGEFNQKMVTVAICFCHTLLDSSLYCSTYYQTSHSICIPIITAHTCHHGNEWGNSHFSISCKFLLFVTCKY